MSVFRIKYFTKLYLALGLILAMVSIGIVGFITIEQYSFLEAFYMTIITIATVGFQEVRPLSDAGKVFTAFLIITSFGTFAYAISAITKYVVEGEFNYYYKFFKVNNTIQKLSNHVVICGYGRNGKQAATVLQSNNQNFVIIEKNETLVEQVREHGFLCVQGDCTQDEMLYKTGIANARALITTLPIDADNLFVVLTARSINPNLTIISRASDDNSDKKLKIAGANNVIMPDRIGGAHMASLVIKPDVIEFLDHITGQGGPNINLEEIVFSELPEQLRNHTIKDLEVRNKSGANIIGFKTAHGEYVINPSADTKIIPGAKLFVLGTPEQVSKLREIFQ
ncbi:MAG TPA: potassium channel protein [Bacteroidia bacterium]|nr:potassium channel protein [Bacteroidia bacterium]